MPSAQLCRHKLTVDDYYKIAQVGVLKEQDRVELIEGEILDMVPIGSNHAYTIDKLAEIIYKNRANADDFHVRIRNPLRLDRYNEPEPDICIVKKKDYSSQHPGSSDVILVIEVADSSLSYDMEIKVPLFAKHKIPEVWIVDLTKNTLHVFSDPKSGTYQQSATYTSGTANSSLVPALILDLDTFWNS